MEMLAFPDTKTCGNGQIGKKGCRQNGNVGEISRHWRVGATCRQHVADMSPTFPTKYNGWPQTQFDHGFWCFIRHRRPIDNWIFRLYGSYVFLLCMCTGWLLETSPSDHYWRRYEVGQWLVFWWFWGSGTSDTRLARRKLGKKTRPYHGGHHCPTAAMVPSPQHRRIQQLANMLRNKSMF